MAIENKKAQEREAKREVDQFTLNEQEKGNFIKMLYPFKGDVTAWAMNGGYMDLHKYQTFNYSEEIVGMGTKDEHTLYHVDMDSVKEWAKEMNKKGWTWVNDNTVSMILNDSIMSPYMLVKKIAKLYNFKFPYGKPISREHILEIGTMIKKLRITVNY